MKRNYKKVAEIPVFDTVEWIPGFEFGISEDWGCVVSKHGSQSDPDAEKSTVIIEGIEDISDNRIAVKAFDVSNCDLWENCSDLRNAVTKGRLKIIPVTFRELCTEADEVKRISMIWTDAAKAYKKITLYGDCVKLNSDFVFTDYIDKISNNFMYRGKLYDVWNTEIHFTPEENQAIAEAVCDLLLAENHDEYLLKINPLDKRFIRSIRDDSNDLIMNDYFAVVRYEKYEDEDEWTYGLHFIHKDGEQETYLFSCGENPEPIQWIENVYHIMKERIGN